MSALVLPEDFSVEERGQRAEKYFLEGYNCAQSVVLAFSDVLISNNLMPFGESQTGSAEAMLKNLSAGFGGGFGRLREVCGAVSGMTMLAGFLAPSTDPSDMTAKTANYSLVQAMAEDFKKEKGSIVCRDLLAIKMAIKATASVCEAFTDGPQPSVRTPEYYKTRPCTANVGLAARILAEHILATLIQ